MTSAVFRRPPRRSPPPLTAGEADLRPPPILPPRQNGGMAAVLVLLPALAGVGAMALIFAAGGSGMHLAAGVLFGVSMVAVAAGQLVRVGGDRSRRITGARRDYLRHLGLIRARARSAAADQRKALTWLHPCPEALPSLVRTSRLWERRPTDADFGTLRFGVGDQQLSLTLRAPEAATTDDVDVVAAVALDRLLQAHRTVPALPVTLDLRSFGVVRLEGSPAACRQMAAAMMLQAITWHAPGDLRIGVCVPAAGDPGRLRIWDWLKWAPHLAHPSPAPADPPSLAVADDLPALETVLADELAGRPWAEPGSDPLTSRSHVLVLVDDDGSVAARPGGQLDGQQVPLGVTVLRIAADDRAAASANSPTAVAQAEPPPGRSLRLRVTDTDVVAVAVDRFGQELTEHVGTPDRVTPAVAAATCRAVADLGLPVDRAVVPPTESSAGLTDLLGVANVRTLDPAVCWRPRPSADRLRVAIGVGGNGQPVELDLKEAAEGGMGPHGLVVGATGSGKSELLRTLVLGLAITHPPDVLDFVLVDFKGGATFAHLDALPHTSAMITNLTDHLDLVDRMKDALSGELARRMELLRACGDYASLRDYDRARSSRPDLPVMPSLLVVVDEFSELLTARPEFLDVFVTIGRVGRSLGVHLLLATQHLEEGRLRGLDTHLSYRIGLKTFSAAESRAVLGADDAFLLPTAPGNGYLKFDTTGLVRFKTAYVSGPVPERRSKGTALHWPAPRVFRLASSGDLSRSRAAAAEPQGAGTSVVDPQSGGQIDRGEPPAGLSLLQVAVSRLTGAGVPAREVWLPPLQDPPSLDLLLPTSPRPAGAAFGRVQLGWVDRPFEQARGILELDLSGAAGHVAIVGAPQSGKSTALRSLICSLALTHGPAELSVYCMDLGGGSLAALADLPQVGAVCGRLQPDLVRRTVATVERVLADREAAFAAAGVPSVADWRARRAADHRTVDPDGRTTGAADEFGDLLLVIDGWGALREAFEPLEARLQSIAARGLNYGVHLVLTAARWPEIRPALKDLIGSRIELRLGDPLDSDVNSRIAATVPSSRPGRGLTADGLHLLTAVPRVDGQTGARDLPAATARLVEVVRGRWPGRTAPPVRMLPDVVRPADLPVTTGGSGGSGGSGVVIGLDEDLRPVIWDPVTDRHLMIFGEEQSGRSTLLRRLVLRIAARHGPDQAGFIVFDPDRHLTDLPFHTDQLIGSAVTGREAARIVAANVERLAARLPPPGMPASELAGRAWWVSPADVYLVVDNYERLVGAAPLAPLVPLLEHAGEIGLHVLVSRRARGAARAVYDGVYATLKDVGTPAVLLSGPESEGTVIGHTRMAQYPPGRGVWVPRRGPEVLVQTVLDESSASGRERWRR